MRNINITYLSPLLCCRLHRSSKDAAKMQITQLKKLWKSIVFLGSKRGLAPQAVPMGVLLILSAWCSAASPGQLLFTLWMNTRCRRAVCILADFVLAIRCCHSSYVAVVLRGLLRLVGGVWFKGPSKSISPLLILRHRHRAFCPFAPASLVFRGHSPVLLSRFGPWDQLSRDGAVSRLTTLLPDPSRWWVSVTTCLPAWYVVSAVPSVEGLGFASDRAARSLGQNAILSGRCYSHGTVTSGTRFLNPYPRYAAVLSRVVLDSWFVLPLIQIAPVQPANPSQQIRLECGCRDRVSGDANLVTHKVWTPRVQFTDI